MLSSRQAGESILILLGIAFAVESRPAQPQHITVWTIEARIADAKGVVRGTISRTHRKEIVPRGGRSKDGVFWPDGIVELAFVVKVEEVLKGTFKGEIDDLAPITAHGIGGYYDEWRESHTSLLWFIGPAQRLPGRTDVKQAWHALRLGPPVKSESSYQHGYEPPIYSMDFTLLQDEAAILARARAYAGKTPPSHPVHNLQIPPVAAQQEKHYGNTTDLVVPVEPALERMARRLVASPQEVMPESVKLDSNSSDKLRLAGLNSLRHFKSDDNVALLRSLLDDPQKDIRIKACELLLGWNVEVILGKLSEEVTSLNLADMQLTVVGMKQLAGLSSLAKLDVSAAQVPASGFQQLAGLKNLLLIRLRYEQVTDANLRALRETDLLHALSNALNQETARSADQVTSLSLAYTPVTDDGLKELSGLQNLTWLALHHTRVTDAGLKHLAGLKNLTRLILRETGVTAAGVAGLQAALPDCKIDR